MLTKKKEDRNKSAQSNSPYGRKSKEGTSGAISNDGKQVRINTWPEWSEAEVNNEKWEVLSKTKEKDKTKSPQMTQNLFDDPDGRLRLPPSIKVIKWKRSSEYFTKNPVIVDTEVGIHKFDIFSLNEHLFISETMRWIICQINILWMTSEKKCSIDADNQNQEASLISSDGTYHTWKFWEHIYALNKVGKGFPQYNPAGKYIVKLFWMGDWRKILVDDTLPFDENDQLLLPITSLKNELWPIILSKALLKIASLSYGYLSNDTEFGDFSVIHSLTGWIPLKKIINKEHQSQIWNDIQKLLPQWTYADGSVNIAASDKNSNNNSIDNQHVEINPDKTELRETILKDKKKDIKDIKAKEKKEKEKAKPDKFLEGKGISENPETLVLASYTSTYNKLNMLSASKMADHCEALRKIGISQIYSHPVQLNFYRDCPLIKPKSPEVIPSWKLIRPLIKPEIPKADDCLSHNINDNFNISAHMNDIKFIEIQTPFLNYKIIHNRYSSLSQSSVENIEEDSEDQIDSRTINDTSLTKPNKDDKEIKDSELTNDQKEPMYLFTDNTDPSEIIFCLSVFCKWFTINDSSSFSDYVTNRNSPSIIKDTTSNLEVINPENEYDIIGVDSLRGIFIAESHTWKYFKVGQCIKRTKTNGTKAISLKFPPGRNCLRIFIQSPNGFHCKLISQNSFHFGSEDKIMPLSVEEPKRILILGMNMISSFNNIIIHFSKEKERKYHEQLFIDLVLGFNKISNVKVTYSRFMEIFNQRLLRILNKINKDFITTDMIFAFRALNLDFRHPDIVLNIANKQNNRDSAKVSINASKIDNRKQSSTKSVVPSEIKEDKKTEFIKEYSVSDLISIVQLQKLIRGIYVRKVIKSRNPQSVDHSRIVNELNKISNLIEQNGSEIGISILNEIICHFPQILKYCEFENDKSNHICLKEYSGNSNVQSGNGFGILFREVFHINSLNTNCDLLIKLSTNVQKCLLSVINNDNGEIFSENVLKRLYLQNLRKNNNGYTLIATVKDVETVIEWKLKLICDGNNILPIFSKQDLCNDFSISKIKDYYIPDETGVLFQQMIKVKLDHPISVYVKVSNPDVPIRLSIFNHEEVYSTDGIGEAFIPSYIFFKDPNFDDQTEINSRSPSRAFNKSKKSKDKTGRYLTKNSRANSSCSIEDNQTNKYSIEVLINNQRWPLSESNIEFIEKLKKSVKKDMSENKIWNDSPNKTMQHSESIKKENIQKYQSKAKGKDKETSKNSRNSDKSVPKNISNENNISRPNSTHFDSEKAHFIAFIISDASLEDNIQIYRNNEKHENLYAVKKVWSEMDPLRFEKGKQIKIKYNEENRSFNDLDLSTYYPEKNLEIQKADICSQETRCKNIEIYRQHQLEWNLWCQSEKSIRMKKITEKLQTYFSRQEIVDSHRLYYFKAREKLKQIINISKKDLESK